MINSKENNTRQGKIIIVFVFVIIISIWRPIITFKHDVDVYSNLNQGTDTTMLTGIDVSHYQGKIDWSSVEKNVDFIYLKATEGITYIDPRFHRNSEFVRNISIPSGSYHFFEPNDDGEKQAAAFLRHIKVHDFMLPPVLDIEISKGVEKSLIRKRAKEWLDAVEKALGCQPIIYSYTDFYEAHLEGEEFDKYQLWLADYNTTAKLPDTVDKWVFWQYTAKGKMEGISHSVDQNRFDGTKSQLSSLLCEANRGQKS